MPQRQLILELQVEPDAVADWFYPLLTNTDRYVLLWGGRDSTKSDGWALKLLLDSINLPYFKCLLLRKVADTVAGSQWATLKSVAEREGIDHLFFFGISPCVIKCLENGNVFLARGLDKPRKLKSTKDPTCAWFEEANEATEDDAEIVDTTLRTSKAGAMMQVAYTFNPDHLGDYKQFWLYKKFFSGTGHDNELSFSGSLDTELDGQTVRLPYTVAHATIRDNPWAPKERIAKYKSYEHTDPYRYRIWYQGLWATKQTGNEFFAGFSRAAHVAATSYTPGLPIIQSWDANSQPYCAMLCAQSVRQPGGDLFISIFKEYALRPPNSGLATTATKFLIDRKDRGWDKSDVILTGDATLRARKTGDGNQSNFKDILAAMNPALDSTSANQWPHTNTRVGPSRDFMNYVLRGGLPGVRIQIDPGCTELIADWELAQLGADGGVFKEMHREKDTGLSYQLRGHFSDIGRYLLVTLLKGQYEAFLKMRPQ